MGHQGRSCLRCITRLALTSNIPPIFIDPQVNARMLARLRVGCSGKDWEIGAIGAAPAAGRAISLDFRLRNVNSNLPKIM